MIRILLFFVFIVALTYGATWLADRPGDLVIVWQGWELRTSFTIALVLLALSIGALFYLYRFYLGLRSAPGLISESFSGRKRKRGMNALAQGLIAVATGDAALARKKSKQVSGLLDNAPLVQLLGAQTAQLDRLLASHFRPRRYPSPLRHLCRRHQHPARVAAHLSHRHLGLAQVVDCLCHHRHLPELL